MSAFSRLQLAAALLEYDNDLEDPNAPDRSAHESAIFLPFRHYTTNRARKTDYLGVPLASDGVTTAKSPRSNSALGHQSRASISTLHNPFGQDDHLEEEDNQEGDLEVDLSSWGLDAFIPKDKASKGKGKAKSTDPPHAVSSVPTHHPFTNHDSTATGPRRALGASRSMSVGGNLEYFSAEGEKLSYNKMDDGRRRSFASPLDVAGMEPPNIMQRRRASSYSLFAIPAAASASSQPQAVPFPTFVRSGSLDLNEEGGFRPSSLGSRLGPHSFHERTRSTTSADSRLILKDATEDSESRQRTMSNGTMATPLLADDNPFAIRPPSRASRFDPKAVAHARTMSNASMGSRMMLDQDGTSVHTTQALDGRDHRYSTTLDLLRPKVLVMPSPLQPTTVTPALPNDKVRDGFELSTDGPPLPPGARSSRRASAAFSVLEAPHVASNSFTPNPLSSLSLSQMTFRNTLKIDGQLDSYVDKDLPRATMDGEQAQFETELDDVPIVAVPEAEEPFKTSRPAGKLFGKSLIDDLENRKAQMRNKQRVFTGDERPSMMARVSNQRSSTLIDPATLQSRPASQRLHSVGPPAFQEKGRRNSINIKPLLNFDDDNKGATTTASRLPHGRSVFGVDTLWEREMAKLKEIEALEQQEEEQRRLRESLEGDTKSKKKSKRKDRSKLSLTPDQESLPPHTPAKSRVSVEPPVLPDIPKAPRNPPPQIPDDVSNSDNSDIEVNATEKNEASNQKWHAASSDEEDEGPRRTTGTGPRFPNKHRHHGGGNDDDDDVPLSHVHPKPHILSPDSDDERPLSSLLRKKQSSLPSVNFDNHGRNNEDDDNRPLGLRVSRLAPSLHPNVQQDDDDKPLAFHPEQQRRSQLHIMAAQQQQHFMMQAQMQNSMYFSPPAMVGSPFFGPTMMPMMMQAPMPIPSPPPMHDQAKYNRVDNWRHDVAVEGDSN
ncbi:hypothetical protein H2248_006356 [Termitomyces sp. 'cryptogamus']|nr:hypothetical protein H2248_006356 [Termitomyces sp. 'cryptogamus']